MFPTKKVQSLVGSKIQVEMKGSPRYVLEGILNSVDEYLNLHLLETVELIGARRPAHWDRSSCVAITSFSSAQWSERWECPSRKHWIISNHIPRELCKATCGRL